MLKAQTTPAPLRQTKHLLFVSHAPGAKPIIEDTAGAGRVTVSSGPSAGTYVVQANEPQPLSKLSRELAKAGVVHVFIPDREMEDYLRYKESVLQAGKMLVSDREEARYGWANDDLIWYALSHSFAPDDAAVAIRAGWLRRIGAPGLQIFQFAGSTLHGIAGPDQAPSPVTYASTP
ncbi:hypothetical protein [Alcanivorax sp. 1008]|uniref:hypothetical protein n=1 Tax=Alcanivorax sp. 1008 TaxID=2816853 RepID=UPI001D753862|nr:hypothetical protein [Alcanivorax sp. 1008]MCC1496887.1 hypothetical protein [Alcanivorax sp. 1008]